MRRLHAARREARSADAARVADMVRAVLVSCQSWDSELPGSDHGTNPNVCAYRTQLESFRETDEVLVAASSQVSGNLNGRLHVDTEKDI